MKSAFGFRALILLFVAAVSLGSSWYLMKRRDYAEHVPPTINVDPKLFMSGIMINRGSLSAPYVVMEFGDYQCPPCAANAPKVQGLLKKHPEDVAFAFRNFPLQKHPLAKRAATIAMACRMDYWKVHDELYSYNAKLTPEILDKVTKEHGLSPKDLKDGERSVELDASLAKIFNVESTPSFYVLSLTGTAAKVFGPASFDQAEWIVDHHVN